MIFDMERFVEIVNSSKVRSNTNLVVAGIKVNQSEWNKYGFYPNNGVVGVVIGEAQCYEGVIYLIQCDDRIVVPVLPTGIKDISISTFRQKYPNNRIIGKATESQMNSKFNVDEVMDSLSKMFGW